MTTRLIKQASNARGPSGSSGDQKRYDELEVDEVMEDEDEVAVAYDIASYPSDLTSQKACGDD